MANRNPTVCQKHPRDRLCVKVGMAKAVDDRRVGYWWEKVEGYWFAWPGTNMREFCRYWDISYARMRDNGRFTTAAKRLWLRNKLSSFKEQVERANIIEPASPEDGADSNSIDDALDAIQEGAAAAAKYARARIIKVRGNVMAPNLMVSTPEVKRCVEILSKAADALQGVMLSRKLAQEAGATRSNAARVQPIPVVNRALTISASPSIAASAPAKPASSPASAS